MITRDMVNKVYDRIDFHGHGPEGIAEGLEQVFRENLGEILAEEPNLDRVQAALVREKVIRDLMAKSGEGREPVAEMFDAMGSMGQEAVLELTEGEPTTLRDALQRYVDGLDTADPQEADVAGDLATILAYPWSGEEALVALHNPHYGLQLHVTEVENRDLEFRMGDNRHLVATVDWERAGSGGQAAAHEVAEAVYRATLARVIPDRDHHVQLNNTDRRALLAWLERPNGSWHPDASNSRVTMDAVEGGGVLVRTRPYHFQWDGALSKRH